MSITHCCHASSAEKKNGNTEQEVHEMTEAQTDMDAFIMANKEQPVTSGISTFGDMSFKLKDGSKYRFPHKEMQENKLQVWYWWMDQGCYLDYDDYPHGY